VAFNSVIGSQIDLVKKWEQKVKEAESLVDAYTAKVEKFCSLKSRLHSWFNKLSPDEEDHMHRLFDQIEGKDVSCDHIDILKDMTKKLLGDLYGTRDELNKARISGDVQRMRDQQRDINVESIDKIVDYHISHWKQELTKNQITSASTVVVVFRDTSYMEHIMFQLGLKVYNKLLQ